MPLVIHPRVRKLVHPRVRKLVHPRVRKLVHPRVRKLVHPRVRRLVVRVAALTGLVVVTGAGTALADCPSRPLSQPFSTWNDQSDYFLVPGGSFEGASGWTLSNASQTAGNEPFQVSGSTDGTSLTIGAGGSATSPFFCVDSTMPDLRLFVRQAAAGSDLRVQALVQGSSGVTTVADLVDDSATGWAPTQPITGSSGSIPAGQTLQVALRFAVPGSAGSWQLDDIYIDPFRTG